MSTRRFPHCLAAALAMLVVGQASAAEPAKKEESAKLDEYQVGKSKNLPKSDSAVAKVERPKLATDSGFQLEKPVIEVAPMVVAPMAVSSAPPAATPPAGKPAPAKAAPAKPTATAPTRQASAGATPVLPSAPPPARSGALPSAAGGGITLVPISTPAPEYPREAALSGTTGYVVVAFTLNVEGVPQDISVVESSPPRVFDQAARRAVARWRFEPVVIEGRAVERKVQRRIDFN